MNANNNSKVGARYLVILSLALTIATGQAQTFTTLKSFGNLTNIIGYTPQSTLVQGADGTLYGTASYGELSVAGTIFKIQPDGSGFTVLKQFTNSVEGATPLAGLTLSGSVLYGTTSGGGSSGVGTVFKMNTDGTGYTVLKNFSNSPDGSRPYFATLTLSGSTLYGATYYGGSSGSGTLFKLNTDGTGFTSLYSFTSTYYNPTLQANTNRDGANPNFALTLSGSVLYGAAENGGTSGCGTVFKVNTDGTGFTVLKTFNNSPDAAYPDGVLTVSGSVLYGTTYRGGSSGYGTVFKLNTNGTGYTVLKNLDHDNDGANPTGVLLLSAGVLYGTASQGGSLSNGVVFKLNTNGTGYTVLNNFAGAASDSATPVAGLMLSGTVLYGTAGRGGSADNGTVFRLNTDGTGYAVLKNFGFDDGFFPYAGLALSGGVLYGTTHNGGSGGNAGAGNGTVFKLNPDGTDFSVLHAFTPDNSFFGGTANSDGYFPEAGLAVSGNTVYGTAYAGGIWHAGTVFAVGTDGTGFTTLSSFSLGQTNGGGPSARLVLSGSTLYGTAYAGGSGNNGTVFAVNTDGTGFTTLHSFTTLAYSTNSDGASPYAGLILSSNTLYGTTTTGGDAGNGTVFAVNTDGTGFTTLHSFSATPPYPGPYTNSDGLSPRAGLILSGNTLYGTAPEGGSFGRGTVFAVNTDGTGFTTLYSFTRGNTNASRAYTNSDGIGPQAALILSGNTLYGTASYGGTSANGTVFAVNTDGTGFTTLYSFTAAPYDSQSLQINSDGVTPQAGLVLSGNALYGTASEGGAFGGGTVFSLSFRPQLTITPAGGNVLLSWPTNYAGFDYTGYTLESTTDLNPSVVWNTNLPAPVVINGQLTVTNPVAGPQQFYRLIH